MINLFCSILLQYFIYRLNIIVHYKLSFVRPKESDFGWMYSSLIFTKKIDINLHSVLTVILKNCVLLGTVHGIVLIPYVRVVGLITVQTDSLFNSLDFILIYYCIISSYLFIIYNLYSFQLIIRFCVVQRPEDQRRGGVR